MGMVYVKQVTEVLENYHLGLVLPMIFKRYQLNLQIQKHLVEQHHNKLFMIM